MSESAVQDESLLFGDVHEVARRLSVSTKTVLRLRSQGRLPIPTRFGARCLWHLPTLAKWAEDGCPRITHAS